MADRTVPFLDLHAAHQEITEELDAAWRRVLRSGRYLLGSETENFEREFADYCGNRECVTVGSGLSALELALRALGIGAGDEVVVPAHTFIATWLAVSATGARPVPAEPEDRTCNLDPAAVTAAIGPRTAAILPVHLYGHPADMAELGSIARSNGLALVVDAAQAHGARRAGRTAGSESRAVTTFSFYPGKNLGALGDGGAVVTGDSDVARRLRLLRNYGSKEKYRHQIAGHNSRLDELQAAILRVKLSRLDDWNNRRRQVAQRYLAGLAGIPGLTLPVPAAQTDPSWHLFTVRSRNRDALGAALAGHGVQTQVHYPVPPHLSEAYAAAGWTTGDFPVTERISREVLSLPMGPHLIRSDVDYVLDSVYRSTQR
ncbi:DegT/DnrJ/EryC1/StrS family aminotransferase [Amycolatopsis marina]|uniref:DegT/DnrJ/EryC1/StrS family aminotransferase n=1 Tax=Amycolatopsis marina TaxID=490629 RepID=UPI001FE2F9CB